MVNEYAVMRSFEFIASYDNVEMSGTDEAMRQWFTDKDEHIFFTE